MSSGVEASDVEEGGELEQIEDGGELEEIAAVQDALQGISGVARMTVAKYMDLLKEPIFTISGQATQNSE